jgi:hypothetical protein
VTEPCGGKLLQLRGWTGNPALAAVSPAGCAEQNRTENPVCIAECGSALRSGASHRMWPLQMVGKRGMCGVNTADTVVKLEVGVEAPWAGTPAGHGCCCG